MALRLSFRPPKLQLGQCREGGGIIRLDELIQNHPFRLSGRKIEPLTGIGFFQIQAELIARAKELSLLPGVTECTISLCVRHSLVLNSLGTETQQRQPNYVVCLTVPGKGEDNHKTVQRSSHTLSEIDPMGMLAQIQQESALCREELPFITLPAGAYDAVISSAMTVNIMNTAWQLFAQRLMDNGRSPLKPGQLLGSEALNILDCPVCPWSGYDYTIDCEGVRGPEETHLVTAGVITDTLKTLKQGSSTGCAGRADLFTANINTELISVPRNIWIAPGSKTPEELIGQMGTGIHLTYSMDEFHSLNIAGATFSIPCGGVYYENGRAVGRLQQMNICGCFGGPSLLVRGAHFAM